MNSADSHKIDRFKERIGYDAALSAEDEMRVVGIPWPDMLTAPGLAGDEWQVVSDSIWREEGGAAREWVLRQGERQVSIVIFVSRDGPAAAREFLVLRATENMMFDSPFVKGPAGLGSLAVSMPPGAPPNVIWAFRNLCFDVRGEDAEVDVLTIAHWLQSIADVGAMANATAQPALPVARMSSRRAAVGSPVDIRIDVSATQDSARYMIELDFDKNAVEALALDRSNVQIRGRTAGRTTIDFYCIDTITLLSRLSRLELEFVSSAES